MQDIDSGLRDIAEIRSMMERASKFLSLSGLSGVSAGLIGIAGAAAASTMLEDETPPDVATLVLTALVVLVLALGATLLCTRRMARKRGLPSWDAAARRLVRALLVPLLTGGAFCAVLLVRAHYELLPSVMLVFYGLALLQAAPMTRSEVRWLGILELLLGLAAGLWPGWGLLLWGMGFGALHVVYGIVMYLRYDREIPAGAPR